MAPPTARETERRPRLTRERVLKAAVRFADRKGIDALSMRRLAPELGVEPMSLYTHVEGKDDLLDGMVEAVIGQVPLAVDGGDWKASLRAMVLGARGVLLRHPWAPRVILTRVEPGPAMLGYINAVVGTLREAGFGVEQAHHALHMLGSRMLGFTQDLFDDSPQMSREEAELVAERLAPAFPYLAELAVSATHDGVLSGCDDELEFVLALDVILDGLERMRAAGA